MEQLIQLYKQYFGAEPAEIKLLNGAGSNRKYYRMFPADKSQETVVGVIGTSVEENKAFCSLANLFKARKLYVPTVYAVSDDFSCYLQEDLGDTSLFDYIKNGRENGGNYDEMETLMVELVIRELVQMQMFMDSPYVFKQCYPMEEMDRNSVMFDLNYFKYCFLKLNGNEFNEVKLQEDFEKFADDLLNVEEYGFQYRDFQARNVMLKEGRPFYIDFQGGRRGPIYYDLASFLWQASSKFSDEFRNKMVDAYIDALSPLKSVKPVEFKKKLDIFVLFRTLQVLGAYGFRGLWEKKRHFIESIPLALKNLKDILSKGTCDPYPYLKLIAEQLTSQISEGPNEKRSNAHTLVENDNSYLKKSDKSLVVRVFSFSYKKGIPQDESGNGGGYVFDCRSTHNPGRYEQYKNITGLDQPVIDFLEEDGEILQFLESVYKLADFHVQRFIDRGFTNLMFAFGCTGGQHRSVYSAQHLAQHINDKFGIEVHICHREQNINAVLSPKKAGT